MSLKDTSKPAIPLLIVIAATIGLVVFGALVLKMFGEVNDLKDAKSATITLLNEKQDSIFITRKDPVILEITGLSNQNQKEELFVNVHLTTFRWIVFHSTAIALALVAGIFIALLVYKTCLDFKLKMGLQNYSIILLAIGAFFVFFLCSAYVQKNYMFSGGAMMQEFGLIYKNPEAMLNLIVIPICLIAVIPIIGMVTINFAISKVFDEKEQSTDPVSDLQEEFINLRDRLNVFAFFAGILVSLSVIGTGLQRDMILAEVHNANCIYPKEFVYVYGISWTFVLAMFFIPTLFYLNFHKTLHDIKPKAEGGIWGRIGVETSSSIKNVLENLKLILSILLPVLSSYLQPIVSNLQFFI